MATNAMTGAFAPIRDRWTWLRQQRWFVLAVEIGTGLVFVAMCVLAYLVLDTPDDDLVSVAHTPLDAAIERAIAGE